MKRIRSLLAVLAIAVGVGVFAGPMSPARADCKPPDCLEVFYQIELWWPDPPCYCPYLVIDHLRDPRVRDVWAIDLDGERVLPGELKREFLGGVAQGLALLDRAAGTRDAAFAARLRDEAQRAFLGAARLLGGAPATLVAVGKVDLDRLAFDPRPDPWLVAAGKDLTDGMSLLVDGAAQPDPAPWLDAAEKRFDAAYEALSSPEVAR